MANFRELFVKGGRAFIDSGDIAAVFVRGDDFEAIAKPDAPLRVLLSGCGDTLDVFGVSTADLFGDWLDPAKFLRLRYSARGIAGHVLVNARHVVGLVMPSDSDSECTTASLPLGLIFRGAKDTVKGYGVSALDFLHWMQKAGRQITVRYIDHAPTVAAS